jgi:hypothetical protein
MRTGFTRATAPTIADVRAAIAADRAEHATDDHR